MSNLPLPLTTGGQLYNSMKICEVVIKTKKYNVLFFWRDDFHKMSVHRNYKLYGGISYMGRQITQKFAC